ncbi:MAG: type II toxin-antitoxin system prevent-host-death family antitoxin [Planctomycetes bacterium]|nr:type II toxin-antitoxin system prevent-host-death family antitoxin [Planctomycetota bacterium]
MRILRRRRIASSDADHEAVDNSSRIWYSDDAQNVARSHTGDQGMKFVTIRDFRNKTAEIRKELETDREVILTSNGRPFAMVTGLDPDSVEEEVIARRRARALLLLDRIQADAKAHGLDKMTMEEIDAEIAAARRERRSGK